jgi:hypothetical protein
MLGITREKTMDIYQVVFSGREQGAIGRFDRRVALVASESIQSEAIITALSPRYEVNHITLRENITQGQGLVVDLPGNLHALEGA